MEADRPYVDRPVTDLDAAARAARQAAEAWGLTAPNLMRSGMNALFECGSVVLRVGNATAAASLSHDLVTMLLEQGLPTVPPVSGLAGTFDDRTVSAWRRVAPRSDAVDWTVVGASVRRLHELPLSLVPDGYPVPDPTGFPWWGFHGLLRELGAELDPAARTGLERAVDEHLPLLASIPRGAVLCHGDVHPGNVLVADTGPLLIDWDLLCVANPAWDHAMLTTYAERWGGPAGTYEAFAEGYGRSFADDPLTRAVGVLRNVAATLLRVRACLTQPAARDEAERRLRFWRGDPDAPLWCAQ